MSDEFSSWHAGSVVQISQLRQLIREGAGLVGESWPTQLTHRRSWRTDFISRNEEWPGLASRKQGFYLTESVDKVILQKAITVQTRQLILYISDEKGWVDRFVRELTFAKWGARSYPSGSSSGRFSAPCSRPLSLPRSSRTAFVSHVFIYYFQKVNSPTKPST